VAQFMIELDGQVVHFAHVKVRTAHGPPRSARAGSCSR
jgi:hypothetical protein